MTRIFEVLPVRDDFRDVFEAYCQLLVSTGMALWRIRDDGHREFHLKTGETYVLGDLGVTRLC
jgi:hypothetical protein